MSTDTNKKSVDMLVTLDAKRADVQLQGRRSTGDLSVPQTDQGGSDKNDGVV